MPGPTKRRIGFLFNHDQAHQIAHSLPIAFALIDGGFDGEILLAVSNDHLEREVRRVAGDRLGRQVQLVRLGLGAGARRLDHALGELVPAGKILLYRDNLDFFRSLDLLVVSEKTSLLLKKRYRLDNLKIVHTRHGAGDRAIGFDPASRGFDLVLCSGPLIRRRLIADAGVDAARIRIVGYPKFDLVEPARPRSPLFSGSGTTTLYNPHPSPHLSSWFRDGRAVLDQFVGGGCDNLVFAPHVMLFQRRVVVTIDRLSLKRPGRIATDYLRSDHLKIDLGSTASTDMSYTLGADVYLGDASSQVYEFLLRPRPCIFLDSHRQRWRDNPNFAHWTAGQVINDPADLPAALERSQRLHSQHYRAVQEALFADRFDLNGRPSSVRAAAAVMELAGERKLLQAA
ncbi:hypothetical protein HMF7854_13450 [Sphingomonas ginkgonis]|uniref:Glycosyl transferase n=1 Tax=Sphingomonas ginkgonis TaxID=2315330 RepID=A0A429VD17_9SPHN|nr:hypothetical protein [Sphingomonas ginkgonis]RST31732.1 hypothetical protein HMF7854_13450 [Sphingomonas ginkgonis]